MEMTKHNFVDGIHGRAKLGTFCYKGTLCIESCETDKTSGHCSIWKDGKHQLHHKYIYELFFGPIFGDKVVHHKCHNRKCINGLHLKLINRDHHSHIHGIGERNPNAKLTDKECELIHELRSFGMSYTELAKMFYVSKGCINGVLNTRMNCGGRK